MRHERRCALSAITILYRNSKTNFHHQSFTFIVSFNQTLECSANCNTESCFTLLIFQSVWFLAVKKEATEQGFILFKLKSSLRKFYGHHHDLVNRYGTSVSQMTTDMLHFPVLSSSMTYHRVCNWSNPECHQWSRNCSPFLST